MKRHLTTLIMVLMVSMMVVSVAEAGRKVPKSGKINDGVFIDATHGFSITMNDEWKAKVKKVKNPFRLVLTQKKFAVPNDYKDAPDYTKTPKVIVWADTSSMSVGEIIDSLLSKTYKSDQKSKMLKEFDILYEDDLIPKGKKRFSLSDKKAIAWKAKALYTNEVATSASSRGGKRVKGSYGGAIIAVKNGDLVVMLHVMCEFQYFKEIYAETMKFANSITWAEDEN